MAIPPSQHLGAAGVRQAFAGDNGGSAGLQIGIPSTQYHSADRPAKGQIAADSVVTLWDGSEASSPFSTFDFAVLRNYGGTTLHVFIFVAGGTPDELVVGFVVPSGMTDIPIPGVWYSADGAGEVAAPTPDPEVATRVTKITVYNADAEAEGAFEVFMFGGAL